MEFHVERSIGEKATIETALHDKLLSQGLKPPSIAAEETDDDLQNRYQPPNVISQERDTTSVDEMSSQSDEDGSDVIQTRRFLDLVSKRRKRRSSESKDAEKHFSRKNGLIHVANELWGKYAHHAHNAHIYVSSVTSKGPIPEGTAIVKDENSLTKSLIHSESDKPLPQIKAPVGAMPLRIRFMNELLIADVSRCVKSYQLINHDQTTPYRTLIPFEQALRARHQKLEVEFADIARTDTCHPAVVREVDFLPTTLSYALTSGFTKTVPKDTIDEKRILLDGYRALTHLLDTDLYDLVNSYRSISLGTTDKLPFSHLWYLFSPGQEIIVRHPRCQVYRVLQATGGRQSLIPRDKGKGATFRSISDLTIDCFYIDFDGESFGPVASTLHIKPYDDVRSISDLSVYPLSYDRVSYSSKSILQYLTDRGRIFAESIKVSHHYYKGFTVREIGLFNTVNEIDSDMIIDIELAFRLNARLRPVFRDGAIINPTMEDREETHSPRIYYDDAELLRSQWSKWSTETNLLQNRQPNSLSDNHYVLLPSRPLDIDKIDRVSKVIPGENNGFQKLVLPSGHKKIVRALINTHARKFNDKPKHEFDVVKGKGRGLIILLHGAPGVGKTSTAECVAANAGKPLFPITCGDIGGNTAQEVERNLENFFQLARKWNCVLLLDEADVFLCSREPGSFVQNSLVSIFLRVLEYYPGILILTTNRVGSFDEAIKSRVHCALYYPKLNKKQTFRIWQMNIKTLEELNEKLEPRLQVQFKKEKIEAYAKRHWKEGKPENRWNGRQIKNAFQIAVSLAQWDICHSDNKNMSEARAVLKAKHFKKVAIASRHFDEYLTSMMGEYTFGIKDRHIRNDDEELKSDSDSDSESLDSYDHDSDDQLAEKQKPASKKKSVSKKKPGSKTNQGTQKSKSHSHGNKKHADSELQSSGLNFKGLE
ncbi:hypothetical protein F4782DRAFT_551102 [Xylaria castorea]|nr:hypothetical protein F4782DRAFT_551102 [Xylaria castorea]